MLRLERRPTPSRFWQYGTPVVAVVLTMIAGGLLFALLGKDPFAVIRTIFWDPLFGEFAWYLRGQLLVKAGPLILIAIGPGARFSRRHLEHRRRGAIHHGRDLRRQRRPCGLSDRSRG